MIKPGMIKGGLVLNSADELPYSVVPLPDRLVYPLQAKDGSNLNTCVDVGQRVLKGQALALGDLLNPLIHAATSGFVQGIEARMLPHPAQKMGPCIVLNVDGEDEAIEFEGLDDYRRYEAAELRLRMHRAGILGLGGAGFPTAIKADIGARSIDTLILNGAECEPHYHCDDALMRMAPEPILSGARILKHILKADRCILAIKPDKLRWFESLQMPDIEIRLLPDIYPVGAEKILIKLLIGREVPAGGIPADVGVICQNVATLAAIHGAILKGEPLTHRIVTVTGSGVKRPQNVLTPIGIRIADLIEHCGGYTQAAKRLILGGPMTGFALNSDETPIIKPSGLVWIDATERDSKPSACIRCGECADVCPVGLLPEQLYRLSVSEKFEALEEQHLDACIECACCDAVCPSAIPLASYFRFAKDRIDSQRKQRQLNDQARLKYEAHQNRKEREAQERAENLKRKKEVLKQ